MAQPPGGRKPPEQPLMDSAEEEVSAHGQALPPPSLEPQRRKGSKGRGVNHAISCLAALSSGSICSEPLKPLWSSSPPSLTKPGAETLISLQFGSNEGLLLVSYCLKGYCGGARVSLRPERRGGTCAAWPCLWEAIQQTWL